MLDAIVGGLIGSGIALIGTFITTRDAQWGRTLATEQKAAAALLAQLHRLRQDRGILRNHQTSVDFTEDCLSAVLAFRDGRVRKRLTDSLDTLIQADHWAHVFGHHDAAFDVQQMMFLDIRQSIEARLDRKRLPKPAASWDEAVSNLIEYMEGTQHEIDAAFAAHDAEQEEAAVRWEGGV
ncbi:hypothetical protein [Streptomyces angustmyceticus]|uniref:hypothetical protein n=1 Tax=Streptomyces angustmyceticus TaxID=285578 RepID=UPI0037F42F66